ncbi:FIST signal transduction protein [Azospirillum sp.]|uniref:FIST signal transduction protein n=1 Tax=Azospirillum sp. TaxID=34012 RepID=UPI003D7620E0
MGTTTAATRFHAASAAGPDWGQTVKACLDKLGDVRGCNLGFLYVTDSLAEQASSILNLLRGVTGIRDWVGTVGIGVLGGGEELFDQPAIAVMAARLPEESFRVFPVVSGDLEPMRRVAGGWLDRNGATLGLVHADPRNADLADLMTQLGEATGAFLVGGLASSRGEYPQFSGPGRGSDDPVGDGGVSGVLFGNGLEVATGLTQGCSPIGPMRTITAAEENLIIEIDGRPALEVFKEDIGELLARDLNRVAGYIFAGLPITGSDTADYLVRDIIAIDPRMGWLAVAERVEPGRRILFARRDRQSAVLDMERMLEKLRKRLSGPPKGGVYVSCVARGPNFFGEGNQEVAMIQRALGEFPLVGFFANGEVSNARLYGYTGVLTLFL